MKDQEIIALFRSRSEDAISESDGKYGAYCRKIAVNILADPEDAAECVNDGWLRAWNAIPPDSPENLRMYFARIVRNIAIDRLRRDTAKKRGGGEMEAILSELDGILPDMDREIEARELRDAIDRFVKKLPGREGGMLVRRYFFAESLTEIGERYGLTANAVAVSLSRTRKKLAEFLKKEGYNEQL